MMKRSMRLGMILMAAVMLFTGILPMENAQAQGDIIIQNLTAQSIFDDLGDALNYGTVAREWEQNAHAETSACVDYMDRYTNTIFANTGSTYFHAMNYTLEAGVSGPRSLNGMEFALYKYENGEYVRCPGTEKAITSNDTQATLTWDIGNDLKNTRLYVFQTDGDGYIENGQQNSEGMTVTNGPSLSSSAHNNNYIGKMVYHSQNGEGDSLGIFNTTDYSPSLTFGPETRAYYKKWNPELQKDEYFVIDPNDKDLYVQNVLINYYYTDQADFDPERDDANLKMGYMKMDGMSFVNGQFVKSGDVIGVTYVEEKGYADKLLDNAEEVSRKWANLGGGQITSLTPDTTGGSTVTGPVTEDGYVVSLYDMEVGADGVFQVKKDTGWNGIPVAENEYVIINLICPSKDGKVLMGVGASDITYFYKEGQTRGEGVAWGSEDSNSSQRVIFNFVYADENGVMQPFEGTIEPTARHGGTLLAPKAYVELVGEVHNGAIIADKVNNGQEIHQRNLAPLNRKTWIKMDGGYLTLEKISMIQYGYGWAEGDGLPGAVFGIYSDEACTQLVEEIVTGENGTATSGLLGGGDYWVKEITPPDGYGYPTDMWGNPAAPAPVKVTVEAGETAKVDGPGYVQWGMGGMTTIGDGKFVNVQSNTAYGDLRVEKIISDNGKPLQGVTFGVYTRVQTGYGPRPEYTYTLVGTMTTNRNGVAMYYDLPITYDYWGNTSAYYVKEISAPDGYKITNNDYAEVYLTADGMVTVDGNGNAEGNAFENDIIRGNMALKKVDASTNANLEGAEFTIYSDRNCTDVVGVMTTRKGGGADSRNVIEGKNGLIPGIYYVKETKAPSGYLLPENPTVYQVKVLPDKMVDVVTGNEIKGAPEATAIGNAQAINIAGTKVWFDEGFEGSRPREIRVNLYKGEDTNPYRSVTVSQQTEWKFSFQNLHRFDENGKEIVYTIKEDLAGKGYDYYTYINETEAENGNMTVTIANSIKKTRITGKKTWEDTVQYDPDRPNDITFYLFQKVDEELVPVKDMNGQQMSAVGSSYNGYKFEFIDLPSYDAKGNKAEYVVQEAESDQYVLVEISSESKTEQGNTYLEFTLVNRLTVPLSGTKVWQDSSNADGKRPENVTLVVYCNNRRMRPQPAVEWDKETDTDVWTWKVSGLPKYDENNNLNTYTVKEEPVPAGYTGTVSEDGLHFTNTKPGSIRLYKVDNANRPLNGAEFKLYRDDACQNPVSDTVYTTAQTGPTRNGFIEITDLAPGDYYIREEKAPAGFALPVPNKPIKVTVVAGQMARVNGEHGVVVNVSENEATTVSVTKAWAGDEDKTDARPQSVTVQLYQNNVAMDGRTLELTDANNWQGEFTKLPGKDANGNPYIYAVKETAVVPGYLSNVTGSVEDGFTITNTYNYTSISVKKEWKGLATLEGLPEVTVQLKANGQPLDGKTAVLSSANNWEASFDQLLIKDENGSGITYSVEETTALPDFNVTYSGDRENGFVVTNTVAGGQITLKKVDGDNGNALSGAKFGIYSDKECENLVTEMTTGSDGCATSEVIKAGTYYVKEIQAPQDYQISLKDPVEVTVVKDQTVKAPGDAQNGDFTNLKRALVYIRKVEAEKNQYGQFDANTAKPLAGAEFTIYSDNNCTQIVAVMVTDENGYAEAALVPGCQYWVKETKAPMGYEIVVKDTKDFWANLGNPMQLTWGNWDQNINGAMVNVKTESGSITLVKADAADSSKLLSGAVFGVYSDANCQNKVAEMPATDENGESTLEPVALGTWYVKEIKAPEGYMLNTTVYTVSVQADQQAKVNNGNPVPDEQKNVSVSVQLDARKMVNGSSDVTEKYDFELYEVVNGQRTLLESVQNNGSEITFSEITYKQAGTYTYLMKEVKGTDAAVTYDETEYTVTVTVSEAEDGTLSASVAYGNGGSSSAPIFVNTRDTVSVQVTKVWNHDGNPMSNTWPASAQVQLLIDGSMPGEGVYSVQLNRSNNWTHIWEDLPKYRVENGERVEIRYTIEEIPEFPDYALKLEKDETQENLYSYTLTNTYIKKDQKLELKVPVVKVVEGNTDETFTFKLEARPSAPPAPMPAHALTGSNGDKYITAETTGSAEGTKVYFDTIEITSQQVMQDGYQQPYWVTYGWNVSEVIPDPKNPAITYDENKYVIMATFTFNEDGELMIAEREIWDENWENVIGTEPMVSITCYGADGSEKEIPYNDGDFSLPFVNKAETTAISVAKVWTGGEPADTDLTGFLTVHRLENGQLSDALTDADKSVLRPTRSADGSTYTFSGLPAGYAYAVKEAAVDGYETTYPPMNIGEDAGQNVEKDFALDGETITNTLLAGEGKLNFYKHVSFEGRFAEADEKYTFNFSLTPDENTPDTYTVEDATYSEEEATVITPVAENGKVVRYTLEKTLTGREGTNSLTVWGYLKFIFTEPGTYNFTLQEIVPETVEEGWFYDDTLHTVRFEVTRGEGKLNVERKDTPDEKLIFNKFKQVSFGFFKKWHDAGYEDDRFDEETLFDYLTVRYSTDNGAAWTEYGKVSELPPDCVDFNGADNWLTNLTLPGYMNGKEVRWSVVENLPADSPYEVAYGDINGYDPENGLSEAQGVNHVIHNVHRVGLTFEGTKTIEGREMTAEDIFTFEIAQQGTDNKWTVQNDADGKIQFPTFTYGLADVGTHTYTVKETGTGINGITLDTTEYTVEVDVSVAFNGDLVVESTNAQDPKALNFVNTYKAMSEITFAGTKTIEGRSLTGEDRFTFEIVEDGKVIAAVENDETGTIAYPTFTYTQEDVGTHIYTIRESGENGKGIGIDTAEYTVTVTVTDDGSGKLTVTASGDDYSKLDFVNTYNAQASILFGGTKTLNGRDLTADEFTFELTELDGEYTDVAVNDADGSYAFKPIVYTQDDAGKAFTYTVQETNKTNSAITYDDTVYTVTVTVTDNGDGTLVLETSGDEHTKLDFVNTLKKYSLTLIKTDKLDPDTGLPDAVYGLFPENDPDCEGTPQYTITTGEDGTGTLEEIEEGTYWLKEITPPEGYDLDPNPVKITVPPENGENDTELNVTVVDYPLGKVTVKKAWEGDTEADRPESITVQLYRDGVEQGDPILLTAENNWTATVENLPMYDPALAEPTPYAYTWKETVPAGYILTGNETETDENGVEVTTLTNAFYSANGSVAFGGEKQLTGRELAAGEFEFELSGGNLETPEVVTHDKDGKFQFSAIRYTEKDIDKTYTYTVKEIVPETKAEGITYSAEVYTITVEVKDDGNGTLNPVVTIQDSRNKQVNGLSFVNTFAMEDSLILTARKMLSGGTLTDGQFTFSLTGEDVNQEKTNTAAGLVTFDALKYDQDDVGKTFTYTVKEISEGGNGYTMDTTVYEVVVSVDVDDAGKMRITYTVDGEADKAMTFANTYEADGEIRFSGTKTLNGGRALAAEEFSFRLKGADGSVIETVKNAADGSFAFTALSYTLDQVGEHIYTVEEVAGSDSEITYDVTVYTIKVTVSDNGDGTLLVTADADVTALDFVNEYEKYEADGELMLDVEKTMMGRDFVSGDMFTFTISAVSGVPMPEKTMVTITPNGGTTAKVDFGKILFTEADVGKTYTYTVKELAGQKEGITYDDKFHTVTVTVADDGKGNILATPVYQDGSKVILTNMYNAEGELTLDVEKTIKGRAFKTGDSFTFTVEAADGVPMPEKAEVTIEPTEGSAVKVDFGKIVYSLSDAGKTYEYTLKELAGRQEGITYDANAYTVKVLVEDDGQGGLNVTPTYEDGSRVTFVNTYGATGTYQLTAAKELIGKELTDGQFTFVLKNEQGKEMATATNDADGRITFKAFTFSQSDIGKTYTYFVSERVEMVEGYTYDTTVFEVKLTISDNGDGTLNVSASGLPEGGMTFRNQYQALTSVVFYKKWQGKEGPAITLTLYQNGVKMDPQPEYVKVGNVYTYENLPLYDENDKLIVYSATESFMDGYMTIYENPAPYTDVKDQVLNGGTIINRGVANVSVRKVWQGLAEGEKTPAITLTLYCNGVKMNKATPVPDKDGWYHYYNLPATVDGKEAVYTVKEEALEGYTTTYLSNGEEAECAMNGDTIQNRKVPKTGDHTPLGLWMAVTALSAMGFVLVMKKRRSLN